MWYEHQGRQRRKIWFSFGIGISCKYGRPWTTLLHNIFLWKTCRGQCFFHRGRQNEKCSNCWCSHSVRFPYPIKTYPLIVTNALYVQSMTHNIISLFIMREAGLEVQEIPKIHVKEPTVEEHSIYFLDESLRIPLSLNGISSSFPTRRPTTQD